MYCLYKYVYIITKKKMIKLKNTKSKKNQLF